MKNILTTFDDAFIMLVVGAKWLVIGILLSPLVAISLVFVPFVLLRRRTIRRK